MRSAGQRIGAAWVAGLLGTGFGAGAVSAQLPPVFPFPGERLDGGQFRSDTGFEIWDWNEDGQPDIFIHDSGSTGKGFPYLNEGTREKPRFGHGLTQPYNSTETTPQTIEHVQSRATCDLNHDGLTDIIFFDGQLRYCPDTGSAHAPFWWAMWTNAPACFPGTEAMIRENARFSTGPESMYWNKGIFPRQVLTLTAADWDGDGLQDLLVCRTRDEAPGVTPLNTREQWTPWGRMATRLPADPGPARADPAYLAPLSAPPARALYFYRNTGSRSVPQFDKGIEVLDAGGRALAAPNPVVADVDGDGLLDVVSAEAPIRCNAFRVDWPTRPEVVWFRRTSRTDTALVEAARALTDGDGKSIPAGTMVRVADFRGRGVPDVFVMDPGMKGSIRWYRNAAAGAGRPWSLGPAETLRGRDFLRFEFMVQALVVDWFGKGSRDLIVHGLTDQHCKWGLRRTALYRNIGRQPGDLKYERVGWFNCQGDPALVPVAEEERHYESFGSALAVFPDDGSGRKRLMISVGGKLFFLSDLAADGLTFQSRKRIAIPREPNRHKGWQEIPVTVPFKIKAVRINNDRNGMGNLRDGLLHILQFQALAGGKNLATTNSVTVTTPTQEESKGRLMVERPLNMLIPGNTNTAAELKATTFGFYKLAAEIAWPEPVALDTIRFLFSERDKHWYDSLVPFYWQGKLYRAGMEEGENWYQYRVDVSPDGSTWTNLVNRMRTDDLSSHPRMLDWNGDGKIDLLLGSTWANGIYPSKKRYRLFLNSGSNDEPAFGEPMEVRDEKGRPLELQAHWYQAYAPQAGVVCRDLTGDGKPDLVVEAHMGDALELYENIATNDAPGFQFRKAGSLKSGAGELHPGSGNRYFDVVDLDGDGVLDVVNSIDQGWFFKGAPAGSVTEPPPTVVIPPRSVVLRNGPAGGDGIPAYSGCSAVTLDAMHPETPGSNGAVLNVFARVAPNGEKQKVALIRFANLPAGTTERAELALFAPGPMGLMMSCQAIADSGDPGKATWLRMPGGDGWGPGGPDRAGEFLAFAAPVFQSASGVRIAWDVTPAVREARTAGRDSVTFLIRMDYTGHYVSGAGKSFLGTEAKTGAWRPQLLLTGVEPEH